MTEAVLFDLFETLITESEAPAPRASSLGETLGLDPAAFRMEWRAQRPRVVRGQVSFREALAEIGTRLGRAVDDAALQRVYDERIGAKAAVFRRIDPEMVALTRDLCQQGIRLAVVSNCFPEDVLSWPECPLAPHFACTVFSFDVGAAKPDPEIYLEATRRLGVDPAAALFIGDGMEDELAGAERAGLRAIRAVWFSRSEPARRSSAVTFQRVADRDGVLRLVGIDGA